MTVTHPPDRSEAAEYYFTYIDQVPDGDINAILGDQATETVALLRSIPDAESHRRYAPDKWTIRQVVNHISDCERVFVFRAFWFARGFDSPLPSFDQNIAVAAADADGGSWSRHIEEFNAVRLATRTFFENLPADAWSRGGVASGNPFTVRALAYLTAGHVAHHLRILRERYLER
jgi:hypothetical protein